MGFLFALGAVVGLMLIAWLGAGVGDGRVLFGVIFPYAAFVTFVIGVVYRMVKWMRSSLSFRIPTTAGQQKTLPWIRHSWVENPTTSGGVFWRMVLEILLFRSLFRNTRAEMRSGPKLDYHASGWLWIVSLAFHYALLVIIIRHLRFFIEPVPRVINLLEAADGFFEMGLTPLQYLPGLMISGLILLAAVAFLLLRRIILRQVRYVSLANDWFPLFLIIAIGCSGILMRYFLRVDIVGIKELAMGLVAFQPVIPEEISVWFYIHLFLVSILFAYFPFSKLLHAPGVFLSPTRVYANNNRLVRHINPWDYPVKVHSYQAYEDDFREKMIEAGLPVEKGGPKEEPTAEEASPAEAAPEEATEKE
ncbi:MAG: sulfate reduction electron transfer complex DsrMKJOP subunit DsrM [Deltaproteobacteria bacterium]|nr:sulfate reduction electron transfer complex DsrMKJOP subunit DsrM [Deltaproteobacteria bacterium]